MYLLAICMSSLEKCLFILLKKILFYFILLKNFFFIGFSFFMYILKFTKFIDELQQFSGSIQDFLCIVSCHLQTVAVLFILFKFGFPLFFSSLIAAASTSKSMLKKSGKSGHPCLVPDLRRNAFSFSSLSMMLAVGLHM